MAKYGISYFIMLPNNVMQKHFVFPFLRNNFIMCICFVPNAISNCKLVTSFQCHYSGDVLIYQFCVGVVKDHEAPFSLNRVRVKNS